MRIEQFDDGEVLYLSLDPDGTLARSEFPDELLTVDFDESGNVIGVEVIGSLAKAGISAFVDALIRYDAFDDPDAVRRLLAA